MSVETHKILHSPIITEETQIQTVKANQYTFRVAHWANKHQIREAIEAYFKDIKVVAVNTMNCDGKKRRQFGTRNQGQKSKFKKAMVTLRQGDVIELI